MIMMVNTDPMYLDMKSDIGWPSMAVNVSGRSEKVMPLLRRIIYEMAAGAGMGLRSLKKPAGAGAASSVPGGGSGPGLSHGPGEAEPPARTAARMLDHYGNSILRLAYSYLHNMSDAEDIVQDTLIQYLKTRPMLLGPAHEKAWLLRVASNLSKNRIKYNKIRQADQLEDNLLEEKREDLAFVWEAVKMLDHPYREAVHLFYYEGYSVKEIASILQRKESTVRSDLRRGREKLRVILKDAYDFE